MLFYIAVLVPLLLVALNFTASHLICGWARSYTSTLINGAPPFTTADIPDLSGKVAIVTGGNTGIGKETARALCAKNARVIITSRSDSKGAAAVAELKAGESSCRVEHMPLNLSSLASVKAFADSYLSMGLSLDMLILNAGVMKSPGAQFIGQPLDYGYEVTEDGWESHIVSRRVRW